jgi:glycosyltransferase involved in cell wall biosynthesis
MQTKVLQGFIDIGGQPGRYAEALRLCGIPAVSWIYQKTLSTTSPDKTLDFSRSGIWSGRLRKVDYLLQILRKFDILHIHKGFSLFHHAKDLKIAQILGLKVFIHYRGSEIRAAMDAVKLSPKVREKVLREASIAQKILVKDGQLAELLKTIGVESTVFPNIVDVRAVLPLPQKEILGEKLRIVHIPTNTAAKGTLDIRKAIADLGEIVHYEEIQGIPHPLVLEKFQQADLVIDQLRTGTYGNTSLEAMALGTPVVNYLNPVFTAYEPEIPPIIPADKGNLSQVIEHLHRNRAELHHAAVNGKRFVEKFHSFEKVGPQLAKLYGLNTAQS